jgi:transcriptional regulator with XRE-family HTH domain
MPPETEPSTFAVWLTTSRTRARYSIRELAAEAGVSHSYIAKIEALPAPPQEMRPRPSQRVVRNIALVLGADADAALRLAGWLPASDSRSEMDRITEHERQWIGRYRNLPPARQRLIDRLIDELAEAGDGDE